MTRYLVRSDFGVNSYVDDRLIAELILIEDFGHAYDYYSSDELFKVSVVTNKGQTDYYGIEEICNFITKGLPGIEYIYIFDNEGNITELFDIVEVTD